MTDQEFRELPPGQLEIRAAKDGGSDGRTVYGIAVPYNQKMRIDSTLTEMFVRGAFDEQVNAGRFGGRVPYARNHLAHGGSVIGKTLLLRDDAAGLYGEWRVSNTPLGNETLELLKDGALDQQSIGFRDQAGGHRRESDGTVTRTKSMLTEVAVVVRGAYGEHAAVAGVRHESGQPCPTCGHAEPPAVSMENRAKLKEALARVMVPLELPELRNKSNLDNTANGRKLWDYYLKSPEGSSWAASPHPMTALMAALAANTLGKGLSPEEIAGLAANIFKAKFGIYPAQRKDV